MKIFISWSGTASEKCAEELRNWLPYINPTLAPFVSSRDISKGERGLPKIASELQDCAFGIVCVTRDNQAAPWINFEAGALSRELGDSMLAPFLVDLPVKDLEGPLTQFQATDSRDKEEVWSLVTSINEKCDTSIDATRLRVVFERFWGDLSEKLGTIRDSEPQSDLPVRETSDILNELVALVREQTVRIQRLESTSQKPSNFTSNYTINDPREVIIEADSMSHVNLRDRVEAAAAEFTQIIGKDFIMRTRLEHKKRPSVWFLCTTEGVVRARSNAGAILAASSRYQVGINVESTKDNSVLSWDPDSIEPA
ncbi:TIR domain-containing protein [Streptomyces virginiae]|uniref:TIR domain-containing protein n=1 Tax=Streptomyces virginiae TaxID=1961 RepID=UPI00131E344E|nr:TIR domain-containing protein [Streptomyces virginiae]